MIPVLQVAIGPVILISGVGLLLLTLTNRYGRTIDRRGNWCMSCGSAPRRTGSAWRAGRDTLSPGAADSAVHPAGRGERAAGVVLIIVLFLTALWKLEVGYCSACCSSLAW
jgi:hypothetical protein